MCQLSQEHLNVHLAFLMHSKKQGGEGYKKGKAGEGSIQGTYIKDSWTRPTNGGGGIWEVEGG